MPCVPDHRGVSAKHHSTPSRPRRPSILNLYENKTAAFSHPDCPLGSTAKDACVQDWGNLLFSPQVRIRPGPGSRRHSLESVNRATSTYHTKVHHSTHHPEWTTFGTHPYLSRAGVPFWYNYFFPMTRVDGIAQQLMQSWLLSMKRL